MRNVITICLAALFLTALPAPSRAQLIAAKDGPIVYGHHHIYVASIPEAKKFWVDALGGVVVSLGSREMIKYTNLMIFFTEDKPGSPARAGTKGSTVDHLGFAVPDLRAAVAKLQAAGFPNVTRQELPPALGNSEKGGIAFVPEEKTSVAVFMTPDNVKVELHENKAMTTPVALSHLHFYGPDPVAMRDWYVKVFGAKAGRMGNVETATLPGVQLNFSKASEAVVGTQGRVLDHIGMEARDIEAFAKQVLEMGLPAMKVNRVATAENMGVGFVTDPWGTRIEMTEGLVKIK
ncbi:MAG: VOC family protein [Acidimicrobiia bacterium]|nr:VOC family protein [Acidimicrobiia bacterium]